MFTVGFDTSALDDSFKAHAQRGIGRYVRELWSFLSKTQIPGVNVVGFNHNELNVSPVANKLVNLLPLGRQTVRQQLVYPFSLAAGPGKSCQALHFPSHGDAPAWGPCPTIVTVLDLIPIVCADLYRPNSPGWRFKFGRFLELQAIRGARLILAISEHTAKDIEKVLGISASSVIVTPLGVDKIFFEASEVRESVIGDVRKKYELGDSHPLILYVGGIDPRKNWRGLVETFSKVLDTSKSEGLREPLLVLAGRIEGDGEYPKLVKLIGDLGLTNSVRILGFVPETDLVPLYRASTVFFFPSLYEGFGLTPLEALATGLPVVSSNTSAMPEVLKEGAILVPPSDTTECARAILTVLRSPESARGLARVGQDYAKRFTWSRTGELTAKAYQEYAKERGYV